MIELIVQTGARSQMVDLTRDVEREVANARVTEGFCTVYVPHTTAGVTINEHADPDVAKDMLLALDKLIPWDDPEYQHGEGNTAAHVKATMVGSSVRVAVRGSRLVLGTWQGIFFCEFDGPRRRTVHLHLESRR